jgi:hypothetical protein
MCMDGCHLAHPAPDQRRPDAKDGIAKAAQV